MSYGDGPFVSDMLKCPHCDHLYEDWDNDVQGALASLEPYRECQNCGNEFPPDDGIRCEECNLFAGKSESTFVCDDCGEPITEDDYIQVVQCKCHYEWHEVGY